MAEVQVKDRGNKGGKVRSKKFDVRVDMTPMVDLGFLLITFFMLATTLSQPNIIEMKLPAKPMGEAVIQPEIDLTNSITLILGKDNKIYYHQLDQEGLKDASKLQETGYGVGEIGDVIEVAKKRAKKPDIFTVIIKPSDDSSYENLVAILDEMHIAQIKHCGIVKITPWEDSVYSQKVSFSSK